MSSGWCPRLHRFTASTHRVDDDDEAEASELAGSRVVARDWGLGYMKGDRRKPSNGRSRIIDNKPICSMADGSGCGDDQDEPVCSPHKSKMARFFLLPRSKLNRSVAAGGSSFHFPKWTLNKKKKKDTATASQESRSRESVAGSSVSVPANISSRLSVRTVLFAQCEARGRSSELTSQFPSKPPSRFCRGCQFHTLQLACRYRYMGRRGTPGRQGHCPDPVPEGPRRAQPLLKRRHPRRSVTAWATVRRD